MTLEEAYEKSREKLFVAVLMRDYGGLKFDAARAEHNRRYPPASTFRESEGAELEMPRLAEEPR